ncbi:MAG: hypothetical protein ACJ75J_10860 [Cytophagaceae bacterium]
MKSFALTVFLLFSLSLANAQTKVKKSLKIPILSEAQVSSADSVIPSMLISVTPTELFLGNCQLNYEYFLKNNNSLEFQAALKLPLGGEKIPTFSLLGFSDRYGLEFMASEGYTFNANYKIDIGGKFRRYLSIGGFYRYWWYDHKLLDLSPHGANVHSKLYWQSATHNVGGLNVIIGKQYFVSGAFFIDLFLGAGIRINHTHEELFSKYIHGAWQFYEPPKLYDYSSLQPSIQLGIKTGFYCRKR